MATSKFLTGQTSVRELCKGAIRAHEQAILDDSIRRAESLMSPKCFLHREIGPATGSEPREPSTTGNIHSSPSPLTPRHLPFTWYSSAQCKDPTRRPSLTPSHFSPVLLAQGFQLPRSHESADSLYRKPPFERAHSHCGHSPSALA
jgi:hypothetical protein